MKRLPDTMRTLALALLLGVLSTGLARAAEPRTIADCEAIQAADAYNQCLAKFGPTSKLRNLEPERPGDVKASAAEAAATAKPLAHRGRHGTRHGGGRKRMHFTISRHRRHK